MLLEECQLHGILVEAASLIEHQQLIPAWAGKHFFVRVEEKSKLKFWQLCDLGYSALEIFGFRLQYKLACKQIIARARARITLLEEKYLPMLLVGRASRLSTLCCSRIA
ncbi:MAG: hypothetical protein KL787_02600 [Taibaiella sp.]|nr:hypothetical protein [Taibaiella sp.]